MKILTLISYWLRHWWDAPRENSKWADIAMVVLTVLIAIAAFESARIFQRQLTLMHDAFLADQRAWVSVDVGEKTGTFAVTMRNSGKTPAINVTEATAFSGGPRMAAPEGDFSHNSSSAVPIPKSLPPDALKWMKHEGFIRDKPPTGYVIAPGDTQIASDYQGRFAQLFRIEGERAYIQGRVTYDDIFGNTHETIFCFWFAPPSDFIMCNDHNKMN